MQINRSGSSLWIWGLATVAVLILLLGKVLGPGSPATPPPAAGTTQTVQAQLEPIAPGPESDPVLSEPRQAGMQETFDQEQAAGEPQPGL